MKRLLLLILIVSFLYSCRSAKGIQTVVVKKDTTINIIEPVVSEPAKEDSILFIRGVYKGIQNNHISFTTFAGKADIDYEDGDGKKINANAHVRMYSDSVIWLLLTGPLGIEGIRAYITKDSVKLLYKQEKIYTARSISYLQEVTALPLDLSTLQDLLLGNPVFLDSNITAYSKTEKNITLQSFGTFFKNLLTIGEADKLVLSSILQDADNSINRTCYLSYDDYENSNDIRFSTKRKINVVEKKKMDIRLDFKQFDFNEKLSFPFNVPKNYTRN
ncbi:MAG: DUF4292 domain-containing protein [Chitinophagaceae bacterium]